MNTPLITPLEVTRIAFAGSEAVDPAVVPESLILAAEEKFFVPVLGEKLLDAVREGKYPDLLYQYLRIPLALYAKYLCLPSLAVQAGSGGIARHKTDNLAPADAAAVAGASKSLHALARVLLRSAVSHIEAAPEAYPEYDPEKNILKSVNLDGGIVL